MRSNSENYRAGQRSIWTLAALIAAFAALAVMLTAASGAPAAPAADTSAGKDPVAFSLQSDEEEWNPVRMLAAPARDLAERLDGVDLLPTPQLRGAQTAASRKLDNTTAYPQRTHGRVFASAGGSDFSCSGTVVTTGTANLIATAGHCVYDPALGGFIDSLVFVPGYKDGARPFGTFEGLYVVTPGEWIRFNSLDHDVAFVQVAPSAQGEIADVVGSRGIGFNQPVKQKVETFGYPAAPTPKYDGQDLVRCKGKTAKQKPASTRNGSIGMRCDMQFGASGGGWVSQDSFVISNVSHGLTSNANVFFGPIYGGAVKKLYKFKSGADYPSTEPVRCLGKLATIVGSDANDKIKGTKANDVIATLGGKDVVKSKGGKDRICTGEGNDVIKSGSGKDKLDGGPGSDRCDGGGKKDKASGCEKRRRIP